MHPNNIIVDLTSEQNGNCELTEPGQIIIKHDVTIIDYTNLPNRLSKQSSTLYSTNLLQLLEDLIKTKNVDPETGAMVINFDDEVIRGTTMIKQNKIT